MFPHYSHFQPFFQNTFTLIAIKAYYCNITYGTRICSSSISCSQLKQSTEESWTTDRYYSYSVFLASISCLCIVKECYKTRDCLHPASHIESETHIHFMIRQLQPYRTTFSTWHQEHQQFKDFENTICGQLNLDVHKMLNFFVPFK